MDEPTTTETEALPRFADLDLHPDILRAIEESGYERPTEVQAKTIPAVLEGRDVIASSKTGTGKTAAFTLPCLHRLATRPRRTKRGPRVLVLTPTRELANQVHEAVDTYGRHMRFQFGSVLGGMAYGPQFQILDQPLDILVATPGRLLDHVRQRTADLRGVEILILDEADRMFDMGFIDDVKAIARETPKDRQSLLFSATLDSSITGLAADILKDPVIVEVAPIHEKHELIEEYMHFVDDRTHKRRIIEHVFKDADDANRVIIFTATKREADALARDLKQDGYRVVALHGDLPQVARNRAMEKIRNDHVQFLVATDVAARGIDIDDVSHVVNFDLPRYPEDYLHRIGRTGRAGARGIALSLVNPDDVPVLHTIEKFLRRRLKVLDAPGLEPSLVSLRYLQKKQAEPDAVAAARSAAATAARRRGRFR